MDLTQRFNQLRDRREQVKRDLASAQGELRAVNEQIANLEKEMANYGVKTLDELKAKIADMTKAIEESLSNMEKAVTAR